VQYFTTRTCRALRTCRASWRCKRHCACVQLQRASVRSAGAGGNARVRDTSRKSADLNNALSPPRAWPEPLAHPDLLSVQSLSALIAGGRRRNRRHHGGLRSPVGWLAAPNERALKESRGRVRRGQGGETLDEGLSYISLTEGERCAPARSFRPPAECGGRGTRAANVWLPESRESLSCVGVLKRETVRV